MKRHAHSKIQEVEGWISSYEEEHGILPGIQVAEKRLCFKKQIVDSVRRITYVTRLINSNRLQPNCSDPNSSAFDPLQAIVYKKRQGEVDDAFWLCFLATHFGKDKNSGWSLLKAVYNGLGEKTLTWETAQNELNEVTDWIENESTTLKTLGKFGNHRKYTTLKKDSTQKTFSSYIDWIDSMGGHRFITKPTDMDEQVYFSELYQSMSCVHGFGRLGKFDFLTMAGKLNLVDIEPDSTYMQGASGPYDGAKLLFFDDLGENFSRSEAEDKLKDLSKHFTTPFIMQVLEDALCNWQKSTTTYLYFRG